MTRGKIGETSIVGEKGGRLRRHVIGAFPSRTDTCISFIEKPINSRRFIVFLNKLRKDAGKWALAVTDNARYQHGKEIQRSVVQHKDDIRSA